MSLENEKRIIVLLEEINDKLSSSNSSDLSKIIDAIDRNAQRGAKLVEVAQLILAAVGVVK